MKDLHCIAYVSSAVLTLTDAALEALLLDARSFNQKAQVSGVLLYHDGTFFQYFEGPQEGVDQVYARIRASHTHHSIYELLSTPIEARLFPSWLMGVSNAPSSVLLSLARAHWHASIQALHGRVSSDNEGLALLNSYWKSCGYAP